MEPAQNAIGTPASAIRRILVTDDEVTLRIGLSYTLADERTEVDLAENGGECLEILAGKEYDLLILDLRMPVVDGVTVIEALRLSGNNIPVVLCSAEFTPGIFQRAVRCHVVDFLLKPANPVQIREAVEFALGAPATAHARAMAAARAGDFSEALTILESATETDAASRTWVRIFRSFQEGATGESPSNFTSREFAEVVRNN